MYTNDAPDAGQNNIPPDKITVNRLPSQPLSPFTSICFFELIGGPHDGMLCYRNEEGIFINGELITQRTDGVTLKGHLMMPEWLGVIHKARIYDYRMCVKRRKYIYGEGI